MLIANCNFSIIAHRIRSSIRNCKNIDEAASDQLIDSRLLGRQRRNGVRRHYGLRRIGDAVKRIRHRL